MKKEVSYSHILIKKESGFFMTNTKDRKEIEKKLIPLYKKYEKIVISSPILTNNKYFIYFKGIQKFYGYKTTEDGFYDTYNEQYFSPTDLMSLKLLNGMNIIEKKGVIARNRSLVNDHSYVTYNSTLRTGTIFEEKIYYGYETIDRGFYDTYNEEYYDFDYLIKIGWPIRREKGSIEITKRDSKIRSFIQNGVDNVQLVYKKINNIVKQKGFK